MIYSILSLLLRSEIILGSQPIFDCIIYIVIRSGKPSIDYRILWQLFSAISPMGIEDQSLNKFVMFDMGSSIEYLVSLNSPNLSGLNELEHTLRK